MSVLTERVQTMPDAQYEAVKRAFPSWAEDVERSCRTQAIDRDRANEMVQCYWIGYLDGLARAMEENGLLSEASLFVTTAQERAEKEYRNVQARE